MRLLFGAGIFFAIAGAFMYVASRIERGQKTEPEYLEMSDERRQMMIESERQRAV